ncbi:MAG: response regulator [Omnitrophica WOR_2 bacterium]
MSGLQQILVVDDEKLLLLTIRVILERAGYRVTTAQDGYEALRCLKSKGYTLAIVDLRMPGLDGLDLILEIRKAYPDMLIVVFAANGNDDSVKEATARGANAYLVKPIDPSLFLDKVRDIVQLHPA